MEESLERNCNESGGSNSKMESSDTTQNTYNGKDDLVCRCHLENNAYLFCIINVHSMFSDFLIHDINKRTSEWHHSSSI